MNANTNETWKFNDGFFGWLEIPPRNSSTNGPTGPVHEPRKNLSMKNSSSSQLTKVRSVGIRSHSIFDGLLLVVEGWFVEWWLIFMTQQPCWGFLLRNLFGGWFIIKKSAGKGVARRVDLSTLWFPSPTFFPIGNTSTNCWDFLKPKLHARFVGHTSKLPTYSHQV